MCFIVKFAGCVLWTFFQRVDKSLFGKVVCFSFGHPFWIHNPASIERNDVFGLAMFLKLLSNRTCRMSKSRSIEVANFYELFKLVKNFGIVDLESFQSGTQVYSKSVVLIASAGGTFNSAREGVNGCFANTSLLRASKYATFDEKRLR